jgi:hypothetical protein
MRKKSYNNNQKIFPFFRVAVPDANCNLGEQVAILYHIYAKTRKREKNIPDNEVGKDFVKWIKQKQKEYNNNEL